MIGPNGAGKTTLVNTLSGLSSGGKVTGRATVSGHNLLGVRATRRRGMGIGRTFQHAEMFSELTVRRTCCVRPGSPDAYPGRGP